jgi:hypothetical protein
MISKPAVRPDELRLIQAASVLEHVVDGHPAASADRRGSCRLMLAANVGSFYLTLRIQFGTNFTDGLAW